MREAKAISLLVTNDFKFMLYHSRFFVDDAEECHQLNRYQCQIKYHAEEWLVDTLGIIISILDSDMVISDLNHEGVSKAEDSSFQENAHCVRAMKKKLSDATFEESPFGYKCVGLLAYTNL